MTEIKAILTDEKVLDSVIDLEPLRGAQGYSTYELAVRNGYEGTEEQWLDEVTGTNYYRLYSKTFTTTQATSQIVMDLEVTYRETDMLSVYINGLKAIQGIDYTVENNVIILTNEVETGTQIYYAIPRTINVPSEDYELLRGPVGRSSLDWNSTLEETGVKFKRYGTEEINQMAVEDGSIIFDTEKQKIYLDNGTERQSFIPNINNEESNSQTDTYSCDHINKIIESGSTDLGNYIKYANGNVIQYGKYTIPSSSVSWTALGNVLFYSPIYTPQLPIKLVNLEDYHVNVNSQSSNYDWTVRQTLGNTDEATYINFNIITVTNTVRNITINWEVIGRWK